MGQMPLFSLLLAIAAALLIWAWWERI